jgi:hypothetical protein
MCLLTSKWFPPWCGKGVGPAPKQKPAHPNGVKRNARAEETTAGEADSDDE